MPLRDHCEGGHCSAVSLSLALPVPWERSSDTTSNTIRARGNPLVNGRPFRVRGNRRAWPAFTQACASTTTDTLPRGGRRGRGRREEGKRRRRHGSAQNQRSRANPRSPHRPQDFPSTRSFRPLEAPQHSSLNDIKSLSLRLAFVSTLSSEGRPAWLENSSPDSQCSVCVCVCRGQTTGRQRHIKYSVCK
ncbi:hypothetical protein AAFF_G00158930 [Aldrovandia affinis]|uniref:Uncharacterized protein n=1 Tax=Aldrovandia affinis TaxID=143900 RepID=A0AAD7W8F2_9TELE|nr:hypothetical protein AAFF_G00158930 [Aldrovandia affinis]